MDQEKFHHRIDNINDDGAWKTFQLDLLKSPNPNVTYN